MPSIASTAGKKTDLKKTLGPLYLCPSDQVTDVDVPSANFLMIDGVGDPITAPAYVKAVEALFTLSYQLKFCLKKGPWALDYTVMPLEGLWWSEDLSKFEAGAKEDWQWTMMIRQPPEIDDAVLDAVRVAVRKKKPSIDVDGVRFETFVEGPCVQILHVGPFSTEGPTVKRLHDSLLSCGRNLSGKHHEIYLSDARKAAPEKWRTILRQPFRRAV